MKPYESRVVDEYRQLVDRIKRLKTLLEGWDMLNFAPSCTYDQLTCQLMAMVGYLESLNARNDLKELEARNLIELKHIVVAVVPHGHR